MSMHTPKYRRHAASGQAVVTIGGHDYYLGKHGSTASRAEYDRLIAEWLANGRRLIRVDDVTIVEVMLAYITFANGYYVKNGKPTSETTLIRNALKVLRRLYGHTQAKDFGPKPLKTVRQAFIDSGLCRNEVNRRTGLIVRFFKWAVENELVPSSVHHGLRAVAGLRKGRTDVRESEPIKPVPDAFVDAIEAHAPPRIWAMVQLQRLTGMRPGEVCIMRTCDLDTAGRVWVYTPESHKTEHHGRDRRIYLGPRAQAVIRPWLKTDLMAYLFSPKDATAELLAERRQTRKTRVQPSQVNRSKPQPRKTPGACYTSNSYRHCIAKACDRAFLHPALASIPWEALTPGQREELVVWQRSHRWHPNQLRHNAATMLRREFGLDVARVILGHSSPVVTEVYAEVDREKALKVVGQVG